jgi:hypothetical protein
MVGFVLLAVATLVRIPGILASVERAPDEQAVLHVGASA